MSENRNPLSIWFLCLSVFAALTSPAHAQTTAANEWTWIGGSSTAPANCGIATLLCGQPGIYGTLGSAGTTNVPGGRDSAATWRDSSGNFWLFGGEGIDANGSFIQLNDLWEFNPSTQEWTWMGGSNMAPASCEGSTTVACGQPGVYGTLGSPATTNIPGGRILAAYWTDNDGNFWLFGGGGFDAEQNPGELNDLWKYNPANKQWTWMGGNSTIASGGGYAGVYGVLDSPAAANMPGSRSSATYWTDKSGNFWLYGGDGFDGQGNAGQLDDLWKFDPASGNWTWMGGDSVLPSACAAEPLNGLCGWPASYGTLEAPATGNTPGSRIAAAGWTDQDGNLWMFGGLGTTFSAGYDFAELDLFDLWEFSPSTNQWTWMGGNPLSTCNGNCGENGIYGTLGAPAIGNIPPARSNATPWNDSSGNLWLFGGEQTTTDGYAFFACNDVWVFEPPANEWAWMNGVGPEAPNSSCLSTPGSPGVLGTPSAANTPSGRAGAASWADRSGNLWLFGGYGSTGGYAIDGELNDFWIYKPVAPAPQPSFEITASPNPINIGAVGTGAPTITTGTTTVRVVVADGFNSPVTLTAAAVDGISGITGSFSPATIIGAGSSTLTISVTGALSGAFSSFVTVTATSGGVSQSIPLVVDVTSVGQIADPVFSPPAGTYSSPQNVAITDFANPGGSCCIYYTTDGTIPTPNSLVYVNPITVASPTTLTAVAFFADSQSAVSSATYTFAPPAATPTITPGGGSYSVYPSVTLADSSPGVTLYYTTDGTTPTASSTVYSGPITVSSSETLQTIASGGSFGPSAVASATYTIDLATFSIAGTTVSVVPGATTGNTSTISLTPSGGFTGKISLSCAIGATAASNPPTCSIPASVTVTGSTAQTAILTVNTSPASASLRPLGRPSRSQLAGTVLACMLLICIPARRRAWRGAIFLLLFITAGAVGCGGSSSGNGGGGRIIGTTPGLYIVTITGTSGTITQTGTISLTVQ